MKTFVTLLLILGFVPALIAQKTIDKRWDAFGIDTLTIQSDEIFAVRITSTASEQIHVSADVEGEYYESVVLNSINKGGSLNLSTGFSPYFKKDNDKLAAHKVLSIVLNIDVPENMVIMVDLQDASVRASGKFKSLKALVSEGTIYLSNFAGDATLFSNRGDITVEAGINVGGRGKSIYGDSHTDLPLEGAFFIDATSVYGDVVLRKKSGK